MRKRTNLKKRIIDIILPVVIPVLLFTALFSNNNIEHIFNEALNVATIFLPANANENIAINNNINDSLKENETASNGSDLTSLVPEDVRKLVSEAETLYESSSDDGKIIEADYSCQNATAFYENVYFRNATIDKKVNISNYISKDIEADIIKSEPSVLIYHTFTSECYELLDRGYYTLSRDIRSTNENETVVRIGKEICSILEEKGYKTIHITECFDNEYKGAYDRSREYISDVLRKNPSIQIVLDIHRGSIYQKDGARIKTVSHFQGEKVAQVLLTTGCESGNVENFPNWEKNLTFALKLQKQLSDDYPSLARPLTMVSKKMNMDLLPCALSIEFGTDANTLTESIFSARLFADSLINVLKEVEVDE